MTAPIVARPRVATYLYRGQHHVRRHPHTLQLRHQWRTPGRFVDAASSIYGVHFALWMVLLAVFVLGLALDAATAGGLAAGTGFFSGIFRRPAEDEALDKAADETWAAVGEDVLAEPDEATRAVETTDVIEVDEVDAHAAEAMEVLRAENAFLRQDIAREQAKRKEAHARADQAAHLADQANRAAHRNWNGATRIVSVFRDERDEAVRRADKLQRAFDQRWPAPDMGELAKLNHDVWMRDRGPGVPPAARWREATQAVYDRIVRAWDIRDRPLAEVKQNAPVGLRDGGDKATKQEEAELNAWADERLGDDPADTARVGDEIGTEWVREQGPRLCGAARTEHEPCCIRTAGHAGQHVRSAGGVVRAVWPYKPSPGGGMVAEEAPDAPAAPGAPVPGDPADTARVGDMLGAAWVGFRLCCAVGNGRGLKCSRSPHSTGQHVATGPKGEVFAVWPPKTSPGGGTEATGPLPVAAPPAPGDNHLDDDGRCPRCKERWYVPRPYRICAECEAEVGTIPLTAVDQRPVLVRLLIDHEQLQDGTCRCGWGDERRGDHDHPLWHVEHLAQQLDATGALAR